MAQQKTHNRKGKIPGRVLSRLRPVGILLLFAVLGLIFISISHAASVENRASCTNLALSSTNVSPGQSIRATFQLTNTGNTTWSSPDYYILDHYGAVGITYGASFGTTHPPGDVINVTIGVQAPTTPGSYLVGPQVATHSSGPFNSPCNGLTLNVVAPPKPQPQPQPAPKPTPRRTPSTNPTPAPSNPTPSTPPDTSPPSNPGNLQVSTNDTNKSIVLSWSASTDDVGVAGYSVERSENQQGWTVLSDNVGSTTYEDTNVKFGTSYSYRVRAFDAAKNYSDYATASIDSAGFKSNVDPSKDNTINAQDGATAIVVPKGAVNEKLFCFIDTSVTAGLPTINGYRLLEGPYDFSCRDGGGNIISSFSKPLVLVVQTKKIKASGLSGFASLGYVNGQWQTLKSSTKNKVAQAQMDNTQTYAVMGKKQGTPIWLILLIILVVLAAIAGAIVFVLRYLAQRRYQEQYDDYRKKMIGG